VSNPHKCIMMDISSIVQTMVSGLPNLSQSIT